MKGKYIYILLIRKHDFSWAYPFEKYADAVATMNENIAHISKQYFGYSRHPAKVSIWNCGASVSSSDDKIAYRYEIVRKKIK